MHLQYKRFFPFYPAGGIACAQALGQLQPIFFIEEFAFAKDIGKLQKTYVEFSRLLRKVLSPPDHRGYAKENIEALTHPSTTRAQRGLASQSERTNIQS